MTTTQTTFLVLNGLAVEQFVSADSNVVNGVTVLTLHSVPELNGAAVSESNPLPTINSPGILTGAAGANFKVTTGGTAVVVFPAGSIVGGGYITNPIAANTSLFLDPVNTPTTSVPGTNGTTVELIPGQSFSVPAGYFNAIMVNATDANHAFTAVRY